MFGLSVMGWEHESTAPRATSSCWAGCRRRKEAKAAALGRRDEIFHLAQCQPLCPCAPLTFLGLVLQRTGAPLTAGCTTAPTGLEPESRGRVYDIYRVPGVGGDNRVRPPVCLAWSLLQVSSQVKPSPPFCKWGWCHKVPKVNHTVPGVLVHMLAILVPPNPISPCLSLIWQPGVPNPLPLDPAAGTVFETKSTDVPLPLPHQYHHQTDTRVSLMLLYIVSRPCHLHLQWTQHHVGHTYYVQSLGCQG